MIKIFSSTSYDDTTKNHGDCIVFVKDTTALIYDCGSQEHAERAIALLDENKIDKAIVVLSHNDDDHFKGIPYLIEKGRVEKLFTILLLKYKDELIDEIDDGRRNRDSISKAILDLYDNIASLGNTVTLKDVYENADELPTQIKFIGPKFEYMIQAAAKGLDTREGNTIDSETITNAASVQMQISFDSAKALLTGDCAPAAIPDNIRLSTYNFIQLPHHGKPALAEEIFDRVGNNNDITYIVSDNTGTSNGGSDKLNKKGHKVKNTKEIGDITLTANMARPSYVPGRTLGI